MYKYTYKPVGTIDSPNAQYYIARINTEEVEKTTFFTLDGEPVPFYISYITLKPEHYHVWYIFNSLEEAVSFAKERYDICPSKGGIYGYKKCFLYRESPDFKNYWGVIGICVVTLYIPPEARRTGCYYEKKCRTEFADVIDIERINENNSLEKIEDKYWAKSMFYGGHCLDYRMGERVYSDSFNDDKSVACSNGIHFFLTKEAALAY